MRYAAFPGSRGCRLHHVRRSLPQPLRGRKDFGRVMPYLPARIEKIQPGGAGKALFRQIADLGSAFLQRFRLRAELLRGGELAALEMGRVFP